jgi:hypothetical protein
MLRVIMMLLAVLATAPVMPARADEPLEPATVRTGKERLTDKASDEQRVNDCKVPPVRRTRARPVECAHR